jgi:hypothetical protein
MNARAEDPGNSADLKARFEALSQHGNVECSVQFEKLIATIPADGRLQGSCCAPMDEARYRRQLEGLKNYADIAEVPPDPYDISAHLAHTLMGYYTLALNKTSKPPMITRCSALICRVHAAASAGVGRCMAG